MESPVFTNESTKNNILSTKLRINAPSNALKIGAGRLNGKSKTHRIPNINDETVIKNNKNMLRLKNLTMLIKR
jgi:hypothetical protein